MEWGVVILIWVVIFVRLFWPKRPEFQPKNKFIIDEPKIIKTNKSKIETKVTVEDMILHDMENSDDVYDIGRIDFNE